MPQGYYIIIDRGISAPGNGKEVVNGINTVDKRYIYKFISTLQLTGSKIFNSKIQIHTVTQKYDVSLAREFQVHLTKNHRKDDVIYQGKYQNGS